MDLNLTFLASSGEFHRGIVSDLLIRQLSDIKMEEEKRMNRNHFDMERDSYSVTRLIKSDRRVRSTSGNPEKDNTGRIRLVLRAIGIGG